MVSPLTLSSLVGLAKLADPQAAPPSRAPQRTPLPAVTRAAAGLNPEGPPLPRGSLLDRLA